MNEELEQLHKAINKKLKAKSQFPLLINFDSIPKNYPSYSTDFLQLDSILGIGGLPRGRIIEIYGHESCGKTTLLLQLMAACLRNIKDKYVAFIDVEHALDLNYAERLGIDKSRLSFSQPDYAEQALDLAIELARSAKYSIVGLDSVAALAPLAELKGSVEDQHVGLQPRIMGRALRKLQAVANHSSTTMVFVNQVRSNIGVMWGNPNVTPGGRALKFFSSMRIELARIKGIKSSKPGEPNLGSVVKLTVVKNKLAPPFRRVEMNIYDGRGFSKLDSTLNLALNLEHIVKKKNSYYFEDEVVAVGKNKLKKWLNTNKEAHKKIRQLISGSGLDDGDNK